MSDRPTEQLQLVSTDVGTRVGDELDRVYTPDWAARGVVDALRYRLNLIPSRVIEPSVGGGAFIHHVYQAWPSASVWAFDVDPNARGLALGGLDRIACRSWLDVPVSVSEIDMNSTLVLGNPPFGEWLDHLMVALSLGCWVAFLLPLDRIEREAAVEAFTNHPPLWWRPVRPRPFGDKVQGIALGVWPPYMLRTQRAQHAALGLPMTNIQPLRLK